MEKKYELTNETIEVNVDNDEVITLHRIKALRDFGITIAGDLGGWIEKEYNLSHEGNAWVYGNAKVYGDAEVYGNAEVYDNAIVCNRARIYDNAKVYGDAEVFNDAKVYGDAEVYGNAEVYGATKVSGNAKISSNDDFVPISNFGSENRDTTFFRCEDGLVRVQCGCFYGTLDEFRAKVKETHDESKFAKEYLMLADLIELRLGIEE